MIALLGTVATSERLSPHPHVNASRDRLLALLLARNFGKGAALITGLEAAQDDAFVMMHSDLQHSPFLIPILLQHWCSARQWCAAADVTASETIRAAV